MFPSKTKLCFGIHLITGESPHQQMSFAEYSQPGASPAKPWTNSLSSLLPHLRFGFTNQKLSSCFEPAGLSLQTLLSTAVCVWTHIHAHAPGSQQMCPLVEEGSNHQHPTGSNTCWQESWSCKYSRTSSLSCQSPEFTCFCRSPCEHHTFSLLTSWSWRAQGPQKGWGRTRRSTERQDSSGTSKGQDGLLPAGRQPHGGLAFGSRQSSRAGVLTTQTGAALRTLVNAAENTSALLHTGSHA